MPQPIWKPVEIANDLVGQVRELLLAGAPDLALVEALERDGVRLATATRVVQEVRATTGEARKTSTDAGTVYGIEVTMTRRWLRTLDSKAVPTALQDALAQHGLTPTTARDLADDLLEDCRLQDGRQGVRMRRLREFRGRRRSSAAGSGGAHIVARSPVPIVAGHLENDHGTESTSPDRG